jgi:dipeptidyl aminopeptidase/acylaminoacyl peptidase
MNKRENSRYHYAWPAALAIFWASLAIFFAPAASLGESPDPGATGPSTDQYQWKIDDLLTTDAVEEYRLSPGGQWLVWTKKQWDLKTHTSYHTIYLTAVENKKGEDRRLTHGRFQHTDIQWLPGEKMISFKTRRKFKDPETEPGNLWVMSLAGGEPYPVTHGKKGIDDYAWIDEQNLIFTASEDEAFLEKELKEQKDTSMVVEDEEHPAITRIFFCNLKTGEVARLSRNRKPISMMALSFDKKQVVYRVDMSVRYEQDQAIPPKYYLLNLATKETREILADMHIVPDSRFYWTHDSSGLYFTNHYNSTSSYTQCAVVKLFHYSPATGVCKEVDLNWDRYAVMYRDLLRPTPTGFVIQLVDGARYTWARFTGAGNSWKRQWLQGEAQGNIQSFDLSRDGNTMVYCHSTASRPPRFYLAGLKGNQIIKKQEVMDIQSPLLKKPLTGTEVRTWKGALEENVEGILYYPFNYQPGKTYPLILMIHGGPNGADTDKFDDDYFAPAHLWCERGTFVLKTNYHGSSNYGIAFGESIAGHYYEYEIPDIEAGVDMLIAEGKVDKDKLGVIGHSNGAILGTALIVHSNRYKAAVLSAGDVNWTSDYGNCSFGVSFDNYYMGGAPWEKLDQYIKKSPLFQMEKVMTPTLIWHGDKDRSVPYSQGWEFYRALQVIGKAPVRFISLPGEEHVPKILAHQRRILQEQIAWLEKYLFNTYAPGNESLKKDSPLDLLAKMRDIARSGGKLGILKNGALIPEVVEFEKMKVGRFEVTRAQWACFAKNYKYEPGACNYPATGVSFEEARKYVQWLSQLTGKTYRLPAEEEAKTLYGKPSGNTFDYWAGYKVNPDDYARLLETLEKYGDEPVLLKPVGSFSPAVDEISKNPVFDLGGNASEWVASKEGIGLVKGGSAVTPGDSKSNQTPPPSYTGFRVIN